MSVFISKDKKELIVTCKCGCDESFAIKIDNHDDDYYAFLSYMKNDFYTGQDIKPLRAFFIKLKKIWFIIRGKDYYYSDTIMTKDDFEEFKAYVNKF